MPLEHHLSTLTTELVSIDKIDCTPAWANYGQTTHRDPFGRIYWLRSGRAEVRLPDQTMHLHPGNLYAIPAYTSSTYFCAKSMRLCYIHFTAEIFGGLDVFHHFKWPSEVPCDDIHMINCTWDRLLELKESSMLADRLEQDTLLRLLLTRFARAALDSRDAKPAHHPRLEKVIQYIEDNVTAKLSLNDLARKASLHPTYFSNLFSQIYGIPPMRYLMMHRIHRAEKLLRNHDFSIAQISEKTGFEDPFYFSRKFKQVTGVPPSAYRKITPLE
jgi:AraC family transcriptional regulator of arabinose operon